MERLARKFVPCRGTWCSVLVGALSCVPARAAEYLPTTPAATEPGEVIARREWLRWWIFDVTPSIAMQGIFDDNVNISSEDQEGDVIWVTSPGLTAVAGDSPQESPT